VPAVPRLEPQLTAPARVARPPRHHAPLWLLIAVGLLLGGGTALATAALRRRRRPRERPPAPRELEVEAELQEMIAEVRARESRAEDPAKRS
jgi:hypothetical protein